MESIPLEEFDDWLIHVLVLLSRNSKDKRQILPYALTCFTHTSEIPLMIQTHSGGKHREGLDLLFRLVKQHHCHPSLTPRYGEIVIALVDASRVSKHQASASSSKLKSPGLY